MPIMKTLFASRTHALFVLLALVVTAAALITGDPVYAGVLSAQAMLPAFDPKAFPTIDDFRDYLVRQGNSVEVIKDALYDTLLYPTAGQAALSFFAQPAGQGLSASPGNANAVKHLADSNMQLAGQLPSGEWFYVQSAEIDVRPGSVNTANTFTPQTVASSAAAPAAATGIVQIGALNDLDAIYGGGALRFVISQKPYCEQAPLYKFPPKVRPEIDGAFAGNSATTANFGAARLKAGGRPWQFKPGLSIASGMAFVVQLVWPAVIATPSGFNAAVRVTLDGWRLRAVQ
jgi:hypothetical protein